MIMSGFASPMIMLGFASPMIMLGFASPMIMSGFTSPMIMLGSLPPVDGGVAGVPTVLPASTLMPAQRAGIALTPPVTNFRQAASRTGPA